MEQQAAAALALQSDADAEGVATDETAADEPAEVQTPAAKRQKLEGAEQQAEEAALLAEADEDIEVRHLLLDKFSCPSQPRMIA